jgi:NAD dependent epimerase/dehydratase family enzyme
MRSIQSPIRSAYVSHYNKNLTFIEDTQAVFNLVGKNIWDKRWTDEFKQELLDSRVIPTQTLVQAITAHVQKYKGQSKLKLWVSGSGSAMPPSESLYCNDAIVDV